jgi:hypothetical protein|tara:strand:- start:22041 stop:22304 length:264 start_codon:yes stop_codon:yes gene_type:complete
MQRNECLEQARNIINGDRAVDYGTASINHRRIADLWGAYGECTYTPMDVAMMMLLVKVARTMEHSKDDSFIDMCGYAALACEMSEDA